MVKKTQHLELIGIVIISRYFIFIEKSETDIMFYGLSTKIILDHLYEFAT